jgi:hypothetical protein
MNSLLTAPLPNSLLVFGALFLLVGIVGGNLKLFSASFPQLDKTRSWLLAVFGIIFMGTSVILTGMITDWTFGKSYAQKSIPSINWEPTTPIDAGLGLTSQQLNATSSIGGNFSYEPSLGSPLSPGAHEITAKFIPDDKSKYLEETITRRILVNPAKSESKDPAQKVTNKKAHSKLNTQSQPSKNPVTKLEGDSVGVVSSADRKNGSSNLAAAQAEALSHSPTRQLASSKTFSCPPQGTLADQWLLLESDGGFGFKVHGRDGIVEYSLQRKMEELDGIESLDKKPLAKDAEALLREMHLRPGFPRPTKLHTAYGEVPNQVVEESLRRTPNVGSVLDWDCLDIIGGQPQGHCDGGGRTLQLSDLSEAGQSTVRKLDEFANYLIDERCVEALHRLTTNP